jgi:hypothetical protein
MEGTHNLYDHPIQTKSKSYGNQRREFYQKPQLRMVIKIVPMTEL